MGMPHLWTSCNGEKAPEVCPVCKYAQSYFEVHAKLLISLVSIQYI